VTIDSPAGREYLGDANQQDVESLALIPHLANANFLRAVKIWQGRRSFRAVGESCVTNLIPDPKPDRTDPPSVKQVTRLVLAVTCLQVKGTHPHKAWQGIQAVERGVGMPKGMKGVGYEQ
jgi:hypothetical protein